MIVVFSGLSGQFLNVKPSFLSDFIVTSVRLLLYVTVFIGHSENFLKQFS